MRYRLQTGSFAWVIHRITGIALTLYIFVHLYVLSHLKDPLQYEIIMNVFKNPFARTGEILLLAIVAAHSLNGFRLTLLEMGVPTSRHKTLFLTAAALCGGILIYGAWHFIGGGH